MHIVHGELRKAPFVKTGCGQDGQSTMFIVELSEVTKDRNNEKSYANYSAAIFAKSAAQINHYYTTLIKGNFIVVTGDKIKVDVSESNGKQYIKLQLENARLEGSGYIDNQQNQNAPQQQQGFQASQQQGGFAPQAQQQAPRDANGFTAAQVGFQAQGGQQQMPPK